jgi:serine protease Do
VTGMRRSPARLRAAARDEAASAALRWLLAAFLALAALAWAVESKAASAPVEGFADLAEKLIPAVVNISTTQTVAERGKGLDLPQFPPGSPFEDFFKDFLDKQRPHGGDKAPSSRKATSLGSGFIIDADGLVVTNNHVIADADEINVILADNSTFKAEIVGRDSKTDLALLRIKAGKPLASVKFGSSDESRVGDWVLAIGNPFGLGGTVTAGILSARARDINSGPYDDYLQTDASINRGNSGGPMFNVKGEVIGVNTAIFSPSGGSVGIGFAVPSSLARPVVEDLKKFGRTRRGWLGVHIQTVTDEIAENLGIKDKEMRGALVASVTPGGPAEKGGLKTGDVVVRFDGKKVNEMRRLPRIVAETQVGREVEVGVLRDGKVINSKITVGELEEAEAAEAKSSKPSKQGAKPKDNQQKLASLGLSVAALTPDAKTKFELPDDAKGVVVTEVDANGPAAEKGLRPGNLIVEAGQREVGTPADLAARVEEAKKSGRKSILLLIDGQNGLRYVPVNLEAKK